VLRVRLDAWSPGGPTRFRIDTGANSALRFYAPIGSDGSAVAWRTVVDLLFGDPPAYELARFDQTGAFGGPKGVRGVPGQRYHGRLKLFGNRELRKVLFAFDLLRKKNLFAVARCPDARPVGA
jgi:hypothetical protein